jgi:predicted transcriptional regulator
MLLRVGGTRFQSMQSAKKGGIRISVIPKVTKGGHVSISTKLHIKREKTRIRELGYLYHCGTQA